MDWQCLPVKESAWIHFEYQSRWVDFLRRKSETKNKNFVRIDRNDEEKCTLPQVESSLCLKIEGMALRGNICESVHAGGWEPPVSLEKDHSCATFETRRRGFHSLLLDQASAGPRCAPSSSCLPPQVRIVRSSSVPVKPRGERCFSDFLRRRSSKRSPLIMA